MSTTNERSLKWVWRGSALGVLGIGLLFILIQNSFHVTAPVVYVCLAYCAGVGAVYALFRMGASAVATVEDNDPDSWGMPQGARDELDREKRTLLKAIKEAELDFQMGKLSKRDFDEMVRVYRLRAIEVIKLLEGTGGSARDQIRGEVKARLEVASMHDKIERAHAQISKRKNPEKAAAAAQAAARAAAAAGASAAQVQAAAKAAAAKADEEDDKAAAEADKVEKAAIELANEDVKVTRATEKADAAKAGDKAKADAANADAAKADDKARADAAKADDKKADDKKADDKKADAAKADDKKVDDKKADDTAEKADDKKAEKAKTDVTAAKADEKVDPPAEPLLDAKTDDKPATKEATS